MPCCTDIVCGTGGWDGPLPGDPDNNVTLSARTVFGGIEVSWSYPTTNSFAVAHTLLYRSASADFATATERSVVSGNVFTDAIEVSTSTRYYYWIKIVSVNGTIGDTVGPASAVAESRASQIVIDLSGKIYEGVLATSLREKIQNSLALGQQLLAEVEARFAANAALAALIADVQSGLVDSMTYISTEITDRKAVDSAYLSKLDTLASATNQSLAGIFNQLTVYTTTTNALSQSTLDLYAGIEGVKGVIRDEHTAWVTADASVLSQVSQLYTTDAEVEATVRTSEMARIGYSVKAGQTVPYDGDQVTEVYPVTRYPEATYPEYIGRRTIIIDRYGVDNWNAIKGGTVPLQWLVGLPLASAVKAVQIKDATGQMTGIEQSFLSQATFNGKVTSEYTVKLQTDAYGKTLLGGYGLFNDGNIVEAGFDVDRFWMGRYNSTSKVYPFILDGDTVYIQNAVIANLSIGTQKITDNAISLADGATGMGSASVTLAIPAGISGKIQATAFFTQGNESGRPWTLSIVSWYNSAINKTITQIPIAGTTGAMTLVSGELYTGVYSDIVLVTISGGDSSEFCGLSTTILFK